MEGGDGACSPIANILRSAPSERYDSLTLRGPPFDRARGLAVVAGMARGGRLGGALSDLRRRRRLGVMDVERGLLRRVAVRAEPTRIELVTEPSAGALGV